MSQGYVLVSSSGASPIAVFEQTQNGITVSVQQAALVDPVTGTASTVDANGLHVVLETGAQNTSGPISQAAIAAGAAATLASAVPITSGKTGTLQHAVFAATQPMLWTIQSVNNAGATANIASVLTNANETFDFKPGSVDEVSTVLSSSATCKFQVVATSQSTNQSVSATAYATFFWAEN